LLTFFDEDESVLIRGLIKGGALENPQKKDSVWENESRSCWLLSLLALGLFFSGPFVFLTPLPFIYYQLRHKRSPFLSIVWPSVLAVVLVYFLGLDFFHELYQAHPNAYWLLPIPFLDMVAFFSKPTVIFLGVSSFVVCLVVSFFITKSLLGPKQHVFKRLFWAIFGVFAACVFLGVVVLLPQGDLFIVAFEKALQQGLNEFIAAKESAGLMSVSQIIDFKSQIADYVGRAAYVIPFLVMVSLIILFVVNLIIAKRFFANSFPELKKINLTFFCLPFEVVWVVLALIALMVINEFTADATLLFYIGVNSLLVFAVIYFFSGLAIFIAVLDQKKIFGFLRIMFVVMAILMREFSLCLFVILGFADHWLDLRKLESKQTPSLS